MKINTHLFGPVAYANKDYSASWSLWFVTEDGLENGCTRHAAKPTKRTVRALRRQFRKSLMTDHERVIIDVLGME